MSNISLSLSNFHFIFFCFMFNCLDKKRKVYKFSLFIFLLIFSCSYHISSYIKVEFWCRDCLELRHMSMFLIQMYKNVCLNNLFVRQLKHRDFICNALNFLNDEDNRFLNCLIFLSLYLIFFSYSLALCLIFLMKKTKGFTNCLSLFFF